MKYLFRKYDQILNFVRIWSQLLEKILLENLIFCAELISFPFSVERKMEFTFCTCKQSFNA